MLSTPPAFNLSQNQTLQLIEKQLACPYLYELKLKVSYSQLALHLSKNQRPLPQPLRFRQRRSGNLPRPVQLVNNFFFEPRSFFRSAPRGFLPGAEAGTYPDPLSLSTAFFCFFQKTCSPRRPGLSALPGSARHSVPQRRERFMHLHAASVNDFLFFSDFFLHPRQRPFDVWCLIRGYHMLSLITCRQLPSGVFTVIALWKRPRPRSARQRRVPEQT